MLACHGYVGIVSTTRSRDDGVGICHRRRHRRRRPPVVVADVSVHFDTVQRFLQDAFLGVRATAIPVVSLSFHVSKARTAIRSTSNLPTRTRACL